MRTWHKVGKTLDANIEHTLQNLTIQRAHVQTRSMNHRRRKQHLRTILTTWSLISYISFHFLCLSNAPFAEDDAVKSLPTGARVV